ncbi:MAG: RsmD family RNA methyltransferase [Myxococcota bacterium]
MWLPRRTVHLDRCRAEPLTAPRLTGGQARGRALASVPAAGVRPTSARVREALFSMVGQNLTETRILDAFAGSGLLALEAWSRGADVVAVEQNARAYREVSANIRSLGADIPCHRGDVLRVVDRLGTFDGMFLDPPYALDPTPFLEKLGSFTQDWIVLESTAERTAPEVEGLAIDRRRTYGSTSLTIYRRRP